MLKPIKSLSVINILFYCKPKIIGVELTLMKNPSELLPMEVAQVKMRHLKWNDFKGEVDDSMPWSAHIYWWIEYQVVDYNKKKIQVKLHINSKSWVRPERKCDHLLNHEQGHYLIGALCSLQFLRRMDKKKVDFQGNLNDLAQQTFDRTMKEYLEWEKKYDNETEHRMNIKKQEQWDSLIYDRLKYYIKSYDYSKRRFINISNKPKKGKSLAKQH